MPDRQHDLDRAARQLLGEIQELAPKFALNLFPQGPAGHKVLPTEPLHEMVRGNWKDKSFRTKLLERLSPPGPNGLPSVEEGADAFIKLYRDAVLRSDDPEVQAVINRTVPAQGPEMPDIPTSDLLGVTPPEVPPTVAPPPPAMPPGMPPMIPGAG